MSAINHPAGHVAQFWVDRISYLWGQAPDAWGGIPPDIADYLAELIAHDTKRSQAVETVFGELSRPGMSGDWLCLNHPAFGGVRL